MLTRNRKLLMRCFEQFSRCHWASLMGLFRFLRISLCPQISAFVLVRVLVIVIVIEETNSHNHEEHSRVRMTDHNTGGYIPTISLHVNREY